MLGYKVRYDRTLPSDRIVHNLKWKVECAIRKAKGNVSYMMVEKDHFVQVINSYMGLMKWCNTFRFRRTILKSIADSVWGKVLVIDTVNWLKVNVKPEASTLEYYKRRNKKRKRVSLAECQL